MVWTRDAARRKLGRSNWPPERPSRSPIHDPNPRKPQEQVARLTRPGSGKAINAIHASEWENHRMKKDCSNCETRLGTIQGTNLNQENPKYLVNPSGIMRQWVFWTKSKYALQHEIKSTVRKQEWANLQEKILHCKNRVRFNSTTVILIQIF